MAPKQTLKQKIKIEGAIRQSRQRACRPKVRTGCLTCKVRRVKCDEGKPECRRCEMFGVKCDGYAQPIRTSSQNRALLPRNDSRFSFPQTPTWGLTFQNEREFEYFRSFQRELVAGEAGVLEDSLWGHIMLQSCHEEPFVLDSIVAISALSTSRNSAGISAYHAEFAYKKYDHAIQTMRKSLSVPAANSRMALIACLLVCSFESLCGHYLNTLQHAKSGNAILKDWVKRHAESAVAGIVSPDSYVIEDALIQSFLHLDHQILSFFDSRPNKVHDVGKHDGEISVEKMPKSFYALDEARQFLTLVQTRTMHFMYSAVHNVYSYSIPPPDDPICEGLSSDSENSIGAPGWLMEKYDKPPSVPLTECWLHISRGQERNKEVSPTVELPAFYTERAKYMDECDRWEAAFEPLHRKIKQSPESGLGVKADLLLALSRSMRIFLTSALETTAYSIDRHLPDFKLIVRLARRIITEAYQKDRKRPSYLTFDHGLIPCLHLVGKYCRDRVLRREAIALLRDMDCCEGVWDSNGLANLDQQMMEIEEAGVGTDFIPEWARTKVMRISMNAASSMTEIEFVRGSSKESQIIHFRDRGTRRDEHQAFQDPSTSSPPPSPQPTLCVEELEVVGFERTGNEDAPAVFNYETLIIDPNFGGQDFVIVDNIRSAQATFD